MSWGYKILILYLSFIFSVLFMVFTASMQTNEMEDEQYYAKELKYQQVIDGKHQVNKLSSKPIYRISGDFVIIQLPADAGKIQKGSVRFLKPDAQKNDINLALQIDKQGNMYIKKELFVKGYYKTQLEWSSEDVFYYDEQNFLVD